jgi:hypothetical protein
LENAHIFEDFKDGTAVVGEGIEVRSELDEFAKWQVEQHGNESFSMNQVVLDSNIRSVKKYSKIWHHFELNTKILNFEHLNQIVRSCILLGTSIESELNHINLKLYPSLTHEIVQFILDSVNQNLLLWESARSYIQQLFQVLYKQKICIKSFVLTGKAPLRGLILQSIRTQRGDQAIFDGILNVDFEENITWSTNFMNESVVLCEEFTEFLNSSSKSFE